MKKNLLERAKEKTILFDGAMGTMLMAAGLSPGETPELWNLENRPRSGIFTGNTMKRDRTWSTPIRLGEIP